MDRVTRQELSKLTMEAYMKLVDYYAVARTERIAHQPRLLVGTSYIPLLYSYLCTKHKYTSTIILFLLAH